MFKFIEDIKSIKDELKKIIKKQDQQQFDMNSNFIKHNLDYNKLKIEYVGLKADLFRLTQENKDLNDKLNKALDQLNVGDR